MIVLVAILVALALGGAVFAFAGGDETSRKRVQAVAGTAGKTRARAPAPENAAQKRKNFAALLKDVEKNRAAKREKPTMRRRLEQAGFPKTSPRTFWMICAIVAAITASLCIVTQRPAEIDPTILSQCNTVFALRMSNDRDQEIVTSAVADTGAGLLEFLPSLGQREAIAFGDGMALPVRIKFDELPQHALPRSSTARFNDAKEP